MFNRNKPKTDLGNKYNKSFKNRLNNWLWCNISYIILAGVIGVWVILILGLIQYGACTESGEQYNHLKDCLSIMGGVLC